jgi:hypothetical protein
LLDERRAVLLPDRQWQARAIRYGSRENQDCRPDVARQ